MPFGSWYSFPQNKALENVSVSSFFIFIKRNDDDNVPNDNSLQKEFVFDLNNLLVVSTGATTNKALEGAFFFFLSSKA